MKTMGSLCLEMKPGDKILIGDDIDIQWIAMNGHKIKIRITAPRDVGLGRDATERVVIQSKMLKGYFPTAGRLGGQDSDGSDQGNT